nr:PDDEXK nuclease domain-containing protein [uncultured Prevotella sp.]
MYVRMYDDLIKGSDDAPTIGVLLCTDTDNTIARYSVLHTTTISCLQPSI